MNTNKSLEDFLPDKGSVYFRSFDNVLNEKTITENDVIERIKTVFDPEIPVNIYDLGLIYEIGINDEKKVKIEMTLTSPNCPVAESLPQEVSQKIKKYYLIVSFG